VFVLECLINELIIVLDKEIEIYNDILRISKQKTDIIVEGNVSELEKIVQTEKSMVLSVSKTENEREILIYKISKALKAETKDVTISYLIDITNGELSNKLKSRKERLKDILNDLGNVNELNSKLIKSSLEYINFSLNVFANVGNEDNNYGDGGEKFQAKATNRYDFKV